MFEADVAGKECPLMLMGSSDCIKRVHTRGDSAQAGYEDPHWREWKLSNGIQVMKI